MIAKAWPRDPVSLGGRTKDMGTSLALDGRKTLGQASTTNRIPAFDFTKGALVLFMVLYHWLNYFYKPEGQIYNYLRFLTPSFIFITGFLISHVLVSKYGIANSQLPTRLFLRGLKLLGVFVVLNLLIDFVSPHSSARTMLVARSSWANLSAIFVSGNVYVDRTSKAASFAILVPISYLLLISSLLLKTSNFFKYSFHVVCGLLLLCILILSLCGIHSVNLEHLTVGLLGVVCGYASGAEVLIVTHKSGVVLLYCLYLAAITAWDVPFPLRVAGVFLTVALIFMVGTKSGELGRLGRHIVVLGKYSLFGYVSQIAILQLLHRTLGQHNQSVGAMGVSFFGGFALTMLSVEAVDRMRPKSVAVDRLYRFVFA
jgi:peptidoglycan/LPS O-acetylase OafA/YrhL